FMLNGALTIGTIDGANIEIVEEVGEENAFVFGLSSDEVISFENSRNYQAYQIYESNLELKTVLDHLVDGTFIKDGEDKNLFRSLYNSLLYGENQDMADKYFVLADYESYLKAQEKAETLYLNHAEWSRKAFLNVCHAGKFSSDRTIREYANEVWHLESLLDRSK
ncbi:MAG: glycogen phosphorylase, partial [Clostridia bacterium]|nr:glycogen phosphorylase [Clostridia bacterium]